MYFFLNGSMRDNVAKKRTRGPKALGNPAECAVSPWQWMLLLKGQTPFQLSRARRKGKKH